MGASEWISVAALVVACLSAGWAGIQTSISKKALKVAEQAEARMAAIDARDAVKLSARMGAEPKKVQITNEGHSAIWLNSVSVTRGTLTSRKPILWDKVDRGASRTIDFWNFDVSAGDEVTVEYQTAPRDISTNSSWTDTLQ